MSAPKEILELVKRFEQNSEAYLSGRYNETQLRREFLDPFFKALGWDIDNIAGYAEAYKDVIHEDAIRIGSYLKAPDYCFRIGGTRKFFVEAKKPSISIADETLSAFQLRRYAWSAKLPLSILSDFEEFAVYDCRIKPDKSDSATVARVFYCTYREFGEKWDWIASIFSRDAVLKGSFDKYAEANKAKRGTAEVDDDILATIEGWRNDLAHNSALRNPDLSPRELNFAVQRIIDRILFLRICEDRGIEDYGRLLALTNGPNIYPRLGELFHDADARYNSGLFHFKAEKGRNEPPDELTLHLDIDDKLLGGLLKQLYYPESPYEFTVLPADILGQVYEQFLGKVIRLTAGHRAVIEDKPEVKKAGGVYYTPTYIVDYIVDQTVGKLIENKTPKQAAKLHILDPACGSGSFLINAYQKLLDWHRDWYAANGPENFAKGRNAVLVQTTRGWKLTIAERKRILLNNIYGVDIDPQAVEVTKLSLLLKVLEGENEQTLQPFLRFFHERALPDLGNNIKCGNSLIGPDFYQQKDLPQMTAEERFDINFFDWDAEFPEIMKSGGFDIVIGNPPYIPTELLHDREKKYFLEKYPQLEKKYDTAPIFVLSLITKLNPEGKIGFISSITWQTGENYKKFRKYLVNNAGIEILINLPFNIFKNAYVDTGIYIIAAKSQKYYRIFRFPKKEKIFKLENLPFIKVSSSLIKDPDYRLILDPLSSQILIRIRKDKNFSALGEFTISTQGLAGNLYKIVEKGTSENVFPFLTKGQVHRYSLDMGVIQATDMSTKPSLQRFYKSEPKLIIRRVISRNDRLLVACTEKKLVFKKDINPFILTDKRWDIYFVLGILNSKLISYLYINTSSIATKDDFRQTTLAELRALPIPNELEGKKPYLEISHHAKTMNNLNQEIKKTKSPYEIESLHRQISVTDKQIDQLVYDLYGLTKDEIKIVEEAGS
jgi:hypothetical protein